MLLPCRKDGSAAQSSLLALTNTDSSLLCPHPGTVSCHSTQAWYRVSAKRGVCGSCQYSTLQRKISKVVNLHSSWECRCLRLLFWLLLLPEGALPHSLRRCGLVATCCWGGRDGARLAHSCGVSLQNCFMLSLRFLLPAPIAGPGKMPRGVGFTGQHFPGKPSNRSCS